MGSRYGLSGIAICPSGLPSIQHPSHLYTLPMLPILVLWTDEQSTGETNSVRLSLLRTIRPEVE